MEGFITMVIVFALVVFCLVSAIVSDKENLEKAKIINVDNKKVIKEYVNKFKTNQNGFSKLNIDTLSVSGSYNVDAKIQIKAKIMDWSAKNPKKEILSIFTTPEQGGISSFHIVYKQSEGVSRYQVYCLEKDDTNRESLGKTIATFTVGGWRGGIDFIVVINKI